MTQKNRTSIHANLSFLSQLGRTTNLLSGTMKGKGISAELHKEAAGNMMQWNESFARVLIGITDLKSVALFHLHQRRKDLLILKIWKTSVLVTSV